MLHYRNVKECLAAIERGRIVDEEDNKLSPRTVEALLRGIERRGETKRYERYYGISCHLRYVGSRAIHWFS